MTKDWQLGKYFRFCFFMNDWASIVTPYIWLSLGINSNTGISVRALWFGTSLFFYPKGDAHTYMFSYENYEEDYDEGEFEENDETLLNEDNVALRDIIG